MASESIIAERQTLTMPRWLQGALALALVIGSLVGLALGLIQTGSPLVVTVDGHRYAVRTHATTVGEALRRAGFALYQEDRVSPPLESPLQPGVEIQVQRARPVNLQVGDHTRQLRTHATTIGQLLAESGVQLGPADEVWLGEQLAGAGASLWGDGAAAARTVSYRGGSRAGADTRENHPPLVVVRRALSLTLEDDGESKALHTTSKTVGQVLQGHGVTLYLGDEVTPGLQEPIVPEMVVTIRRSVPIQIQADGHTIRTRTRAESVARALGQVGIALMGKDRVEPGLSSPVQSEMNIRIVRVREDLLVEFEPIPFETEWVPDPEVEIDNIRLVREGQLGITKRRYRIVSENDQEVARSLEDVWTEQPPITKTMAYGTKIVIRTLETPDGPIEYWRKMRVYVTSYMPASCGKPKDHPRYGYTRLGWKLRRGIVAVDPTVIPLRTSLYVPGYGVARAGDTGGGVKGKFVDLGFSDDDYESWHWWMDVYILTPVPAASKIRWILPDWPKFPDRRRR